MDTRGTIETYLLGALNSELEELDKYAADRTTQFLYARARELWWTAARLLGLGNLHDGAGQRGLENRPVYDGAVPPSAQGRVLIDVTALRRFSFASGVQRVVREIARAAVETGVGLPVFIDDGRVHGYWRHAALPDEITFAAGDTLLLLDAGWGFAHEYPPIMEAVRRASGVTVAALYDIIPLLYPAAVERANGRAFEVWFDTVVTKADAVVAISKSVADDYIAHMRGRGRDAANLARVGHWPLGADFTVAVGAPSPLAKRIGDGSAFFLSVGTLEPRKAYPVALDAMERLWAEGVEARYVVVGRRGWNTRALQRRLREHPEAGRRLFWLDAASDAELQYLYPRARALVFPSFAEGFGLPLVEAAHYGARVVASDIPVFREVGGERGDYFDLLDPVALATRLRAALDSPPAPSPPETPVDWRQSAQLLADEIATLKNKTGTQ